MKKRILAITFIFLIITLSIIFSVYLASIKKVCINENCFKVELAKTPESREIGLMNREFLDSDRGMLFIFDDSDIHSFWMKETLIPLDIIWISGGNKIVGIAKNVQPCLEEKCPTITPKFDSKYVLEINSNLSESLGIKIGDKVNF